MKSAFPERARFPAILAVLACAAVASAGAPTSSTPPTTERPRLVVMISVDQMIPEQFERLGTHFDGGLQRFLERGRMFPEAALSYGATETGPGHATFLTGCDPWKHGIVGNTWLPQEGTMSEYCVRDRDVRGVTNAGVGADEDPTGRVSAKYLNRPTLGEMMRAADGASMTVSISSKDRAAVCMAGAEANVVLWWDRARGGFMSSTAYAEQLPGWVRGWNATWPSRWSEGPFARGWTSTIPADWRQAGTGEDGRPGEAGSPNIFPHELPAVSGSKGGEAAAAAFSTAVGDHFVAEMAIAAVEGLNLGRDEHADLLAVSFSACDTVGHAYGPYSHEVTDVMMRLDEELERLFTVLDERVGAGRWVAALTADHGVLPLPEWLLEQGVGARRVPFVEMRASHAAMRRVLGETFGDDYVLNLNGRAVRFSAQAVAEAGHSLSEVRRVAARALQEHGASWIERVWTLDEIAEIAAQGAPSSSGWGAAWARCFHPERTADLVVQAKPWHLLAMEAGTSHGTVYPYDRRVPLAFLGAGVEPGVEFGSASPADAVATLLPLLGLPTPPGLDGRALPLE